MAMMLPVRPYHGKGDENGGKTIMELIDSRWQISRYIPEI